MIAEDDLPALEGAIHAAASYAEGFGAPAGTEMHGHRIMSGRDGFECVRGKHRAATAIYERALRYIAGAPVSVFIRGVDVVRLNARYRYPLPPHQVVLQHVLEDVSNHGRSQGQAVTVIADEVSDQDGHAERVARFQITGTPGYRSQTLPNITMPITFASSAATPGLQAADLIVYLHRRHEDHFNASWRSDRPDPDPRAVAAANRLWTTIEPRIAKTWTWTP